MTILVSQTYQQTTPESVADGDFSETGFNFEDQPHTFRDLVALMREHPNPNSNPLREVTPNTWFSSESSVIDYSDGTMESTSIHLSRKNEIRAAKYWAKAARVAGLIQP